MKSIIRQFTILHLFIIILLILISAKTNGQKIINPSCEQTVIYHVSKIIENGKEFDVNISVTVNPIQKTIDLLAITGQTTAKFNVSIVSKSCDLDLDLKKGMAIYQTNMKAHLNSSGVIKIKLEDGKIAISYVDDKQVILRKFFADRWEIVKEN